MTHLCVCVVPVHSGSQPGGNCKILGYHISVAEGSSYVGCDSVSCK